MLLEVEDHLSWPLTPLALSANTSVWDVNTSSLNDGSILATATVCGHSKLCMAEPTSLTRYLFLLFRWTPPVYRRWHEFTLSSCKTTKLVTRATSSRRPIDATATSDIWNDPHSNNCITITTPAYEYFLLVWWSSSSGNIKQFHAWNSCSNHWCTHTPSTQRPRAPSSRYGTTIPPLRPKPSFQQPTPYDRRIITRAPTLHPEDAKSHIAWNLPYALIPDPGFTIACSTHRKTQKRPTAPSSHGRGNPFATTQVIIHRAPGPNFRFHQFKNLMGSSRCSCPRAN